MGLKDTVKWGPMAGDLQAVLPRIDELPRDWLLFRTDKKSAPRPWLSGTLALISVQFHMGPQHEPFLKAMNDPLMVSLQTLSKPLLLMSEYACMWYTLGTGWALTESFLTPDSELALSRDCMLKRTRFMEFLDEDNMGNFIQTYHCNEETVAFGYTRELSGRRNATVVGFINMNTGHTVIVNRQIDSRNCEECEFYKRDCSCESGEIEAACESNALIRREFGRRAYHGSTIGTKYMQNWVVGSWTSNTIGNPFPVYNYDIRASNQSVGFCRVLSSVIQDEVSRIHPPRQSQIFLSCAEPPQVSGSFVSSLLSHTEPAEDWSKIVHLTEDECTESENGDTNHWEERKKIYQESVENMTHSSYPYQSKAVKSPSIVANNYKGKSVLREETISPDLRQDETRRNFAASERDIPCESIESPKPELRLSWKNAETENTANDKKGSNGSKLFSCQKCPVTFKRRYDLGRHVRNVHERRRDFFCKECGKEFSQSGHLNEHVKVLHTRFTSHMCETCGKAFGTKGKLKVHVQSVHENRRGHRCEICEKCFKDPSSRRQHMKSVHSEMPIRTKIGETAEGDDQLIPDNSGVSGLNISQ